MRGAVILFLLTGCASPAMNIANIAANTGSLVATEKTISDHVLSAARDEDCAVWRIVNDEPVCKEGSMVASVEIVYADEMEGERGEADNRRSIHSARGRIRPAVHVVSYQNSCLNSRQWRRAVMDYDEFENGWEMATLPPRCAPVRIERKGTRVARRIPQRIARRLHDDSKMRAALKPRAVIKPHVTIESLAAIGPSVDKDLPPREPGPEDLDVMGLEEGQSSGEKKIAGSASPDMAKGGGEYLYRLGAGDKLRVNVFGEKDLSGEFQVSAAGEVSLPLIGSVSAGGLTLEGFNKLVGIRLRDGYLKQPKVSAEITNYRPVYVLGEVRSPGPYEYINRMTVLQAVALAGGYTYRANERKIKIDRRIRVLGLTGKAGSDTRLLPGDVVHIPERFF